MEIPKEQSVVFLIPTKILLQDFYTAWRWQMQFTIGMMRLKKYVYVYEVTNVVYKNHGGLRIWNLMNGVSQELQCLVLAAASEFDKCDRISCFGIRALLMFPQTLWCIYLLLPFMIELICEDWIEFLLWLRLHASVKTTLMQAWKLLSCRMWLQRSECITGLTMCSSERNTNTINMLICIIKSATKIVLNKSVHCDSLWLDSSAENTGSILCWKFMVLSYSIWFLHINIIEWPKKSIE